LQDLLPTKNKNAMPASRDGIFYYEENN